MSGLGSVSSSQNLFAYLRSTAGGNSTDELAMETKQTREGQMEARIDQALSAAGIDEETAEALKADLRAAFEESQAAGTFPPDPDAMKSAVDAVFAEYGLDAGEILGPPPWRGMHGASGGEFKARSVDDAKETHQTLLDLLNQMAEEGASSEEMSQLLIDALNGLDQMA